MKISRLDLDGAGSPAALVTRILKVEPDLPIPVPIEALCEQLDIIRIADLETEGFEAALLTDENKSNGAILIAKGPSRQRRRFSIGHELGHFLIPSHVPGPGGQILCSKEDLLAFDPKEQDRRRRMEFEANQFAALLLMPPPLLRSELAKGGLPNLAKFVALAKLFDVSKQALAWQYVAYHHEAVAIVQTQHGRILDIYRKPGKFPWIESTRSQEAPRESMVHDTGGAPGTTSEIVDCIPELWLSADAARTVDSMTEQVLNQSDGFALVMLHAELRDEEDSARVRNIGLLRW